MTAQQLARLTFSWGEGQLVATYSGDDTWQVPGNLGLQGLLNSGFTKAALDLGPAFGDPAHYVANEVATILSAKVTWLHQLNSLTSPNIDY